MYPVIFSTLTQTEDGTLREVNTRTIRREDILACPFTILVADHYREDGTCKCDDPEEREMMIKEWDYTPKDFRDIPLRGG